MDSHCHLDVARFDADREEVLARAWAAGLCGIVIPAIGPADWEALLALPAKDPRLQIGLGIHPQLLPSLPESEDEAHLARLDELLGRGVACAVGECGLDGPSASGPAGAPLERQVRVLRGHLELAQRHGLPVLLHCLRLHPALVELLKEVPIPEAGLLLHSYSGGLDLAKFYAAQGCHFSFAGPVSFLDARKPLAALRAVPRGRLLLETDAPDQAPHPHRGERNEPGWLPHVAQAAARALELPLEALARETTGTARRLFRRPFGAETG